MGKSVRRALALSVGLVVCATASDSRADCAALRRVLELELTSIAHDGVETDRAPYVGITTRVTTYSTASVNLELERTRGAPDDIFVRVQFDREGGP